MNDLYKSANNIKVVSPTKQEDPVLLMIGVGRELWEHEPGDHFVERMRNEDALVPETPDRPAENLTEAVWQRIRAHQRESFHTATGLPFTFEVDGKGIWFFRDQKRVNRKLSRKQVEIAVSRCPLRNTTEIKDLIDYPYLCALLMDPRIRDGAW